MLVVTCITIFIFYSYFDFFFLWYRTTNMRVTILLHMTLQTISVKWQRITIAIHLMFLTIVNILVKFLFLVLHFQNYLFLLYLLISFCLANILICIWLNRTRGASKVYSHLSRLWRLVSPFGISLCRNHRSKYNASE
jgi:hypothetical protein